jgi:hypothetical protein
MTNCGNGKGGKPMRNRHRSDVPRAVLLSWPPPNGERFPGRPPIYFGRLAHGLAVIAAIALVSIAAAL